MIRTVAPTIVSLSVALLVGALAACSAGVDEAAVVDDHTRAPIEEG